MADWSRFIRQSDIGLGWKDVDSLTQCQQNDTFTHDAHPSKGLAKRNQQREADRPGFYVSEPFIGELPNVLTRSFVGTASRLR